MTPSCHVDISKMAAKGEEFESFKQCIKSLATAAEAFQRYTTSNSASSPNARCSQTSSPVTQSTKPNALDEHRKLFGFKPSTSLSSFNCGRPNAKRQRTEKRSSGKIFVPVRNTWTHKFFLFSNNTSRQVPTLREKVQHGLAGLGDRDMVFDKDGNSEHIKKKLQESYPVLNGCGGFEIMRTISGSCKILEIVPVPPGGYNVPYLKSVLSQAKAYIRPIQKHLSLQPLSSKEVSSHVSRDCTSYSTLVGVVGLTASIYAVLLIKDYSRGNYIL